MAAETSMRPYFFRGDYIKGDPKLGTLHAQSGHRLLILPEELLQGLHNAVVYETGHAWSVVAYTCGRKWGERILSTWHAEWETYYATRMEDVEYSTFEVWLACAFEFYGWGELEIDFSLEREGVVQFWLGNSVLAELLGDLESPHVCEIFAGLFATVTSWMAKLELDAVEIECSKSGAERCRFVVALPERIEHARGARMRGASTDQIMASLLETN